MTSWPQTCGYCGAPIHRGFCPRCHYRKPPEGKVVLSGVDLTPAASAPIVVNPSSVINRGTNTSQLSSTTITVSAMIGTTGSTLAVSVIFDNALATTSTAKWGATSMTNVGATQGTTNAITMRFVLFNATAGTNTVTVTFDAACTRKAISALEITKLIAAPSDQRTSKIGTSTTPDSGLALATVQASEVLWGTVFTEGPSTDAAGTWTNGYTGAQRAGTNTAGVNVTVSDGYNLVTAVGTYSAGKTGITSRDWTAYIDTLKTT